jgi:uncharacterized protein
MSTEIFTVGALSAGPGKKTFGVNEFTVQGQPYRVPMWLINGSGEGPTLALTGGVHAAEYASIAAALDLGRNIEAASVHGRVIIVPVMNIPGFGVRSIYLCPLDGQNINRVFPGNPDGSASQQIADWMFKNVLTKADYYVDLHGGDLIEALVPFTIIFRSGHEELDRTTLELAKVFGIHYVVRSETPGSTYSEATKAGVPSLLVESGGQGIWPAADVELLTTGVDRLMRHLKMLAGPAPEALPSTLLNQFLWLRSSHTAFWYPAVAVNDAVKAGQDLGAVKDHEGTVLQSAISPADGRVLFLVSSLAINAGDPLLAVGA